jgi:hypothetical protein
MLSKAFPAGRQIAEILIFALTCENPYSVRL